MKTASGRIRTVNSLITNEVPYRQATEANTRLSAVMVRLNQRRSALSVSGGLREIQPRGCSGNNMLVGVNRFERSMYPQWLILSQLRLANCAIRPCMVFVEGYDPSTPALKVLCYYQLSYTKSLRPITVGVSPDDIVATNHQTSTLAETVRFERTVGNFPTAIQQTAAFDHSATFPRKINRS